MAAGIICEYNPFHNGHRYHIEKTRELTGDGIVAVMSGNFVQRGEPALLDKSIRVKNALNGGVDLVVELPLHWSIASAEGFAFGGVSILECMGIIDNISFGSESENADLIMKTAEILSNGEVYSQIGKELENGVSYPVARQTVIEKYGKEYAEILSLPNDILGVEYCKAIIKLGSKIKPVAIKRYGAGHNSDRETAGILSAGEIRRRVKNGDDISEFVPDYAYFSADDCYDFSLAERSVLAVMRKMKTEDFARLPDVSEGLEYRILDSVKKSKSISELYENIKTKRYTLSRIRRIILCAYLGITEDYSKKIPPYIRVLGFNDNGRELIRNIKKNGNLPVVMRYADINRLDDFAKKVFEEESTAGDLFGLAGGKIGICGSEKTRNPEILIGNG